MISRTGALTLPAALALVAACSSAGSTATPAAPASSAAAPTVSSAAPATSAAPSESANPYDFTVTVADGKIVGGLKTVDVPVGETFRVTVTSDVADEVHLHGYDVHADLAAGGSATVEQEATIPGVVVVELEEAGLTVLRVASR